MNSTYPTISAFTPAVLAATCRTHKMSTEEFRLGALKRAECDLGNFLENGLADIHPDDRAVLEDLHRAIRLATGDE